MPKKRHQSKYSKPQTTAPASLSTSAPVSNSLENQRRGVNDLLASLRRTSLASSNHTSSLSATTPSVPPTIRQILQLPETPPPSPRRPARRDASGRRLPPGPPAPKSWLLRHADGVRVGVSKALSRAHRLPGVYEPGRGSLTDIALRQMAIEWLFQKTYNRYYLYSLPSRLRSSLIRYLSLWHSEGVSGADLRTILVPHEDDVHGSYTGAGAVTNLNDDFYFLDLSSSVGRSITIKELIDFLFPSRSAHPSTDVQDSWDTVEPISVPAQLLPKLTHLSLATTPEHASNASWRHLLLLASKLSTVTHLCLAYWPEPSLTPNAKYASVISAQGGTIQYSGTGPYSHTLDDDWSEAVSVLRKLSKSLYGLEYLDLTGCGAWFKALMVTVDQASVDWGGEWMKISTLRLRYGYEVNGIESISDRIRFRNSAEMARSVEKHIIARRAGRGRFITVDRDDPNMSELPIAGN